MLKNNKHHSSKLQHAYNRAKDKDIFIYSIVEIVEYKEDLPLREKYYIDLYNSLYDGYNCADVGKFLTESMIKKKKEKEKQKYYYDMFSNLYNPDFIKIGIGKTWTERLKQIPYHYSSSTMRRLCIILKWFYDNYDINELKLNITVPSGGGNSFIANIYNNEDRIYQYKFGSKNNKYVPIIDWSEIRNEKEITKEDLKQWNFDDSFYK